MKKSDSVLCCYCGNNVATTKDHIPPKSIFTKPRPSDLITVPCCFECNNKVSSIDERFKAYLGLHVARSGGLADKFFKQGTLPTTRHNRSLKNTVLTSTKRIFLYDGFDPVPREMYLAKWDNEAHDVTIERITRGLFYYHYGKIIGNDASIQVSFFDKPPGNFGYQLEANSVGNGLFNYKYAKAEDCVYSSIWLLEFYGSHFAGALVSVRKDLK